MTQKALSPEDIARITAAHAKEAELGKGTRGVEAMFRVIGDLLAHIAVLEADNAAMLRAINSAQQRWAAQDQWATMETLREETEKAHPGAALLERHEQEVELATLQIDEHVQSAKRAWDAAHGSEQALEACREHVRQTGEEHRKALARARNEGLAKAGQWLVAKGYVRAETVRHLERLMEPEQ